MLPRIITPGFLLPPEKSGGGSSVLEVNSRNSHPSDLLKAEDLNVHYVGGIPGLQIKTYGRTFTLYRRSSLRKSRAPLETGLSTASFQHKPQPLNSQTSMGWILDQIDPVRLHGFLASEIENIHALDKFCLRRQFTYLVQKELVYVFEAYCDGEGNPILAGDIKAPVPAKSSEYVPVSVISDNAAFAIEPRVRRPNSDAPPLSAPQPEVSFVGHDTQATALVAAAKVGTPFCEICMANQSVPVEFAA